MRMRRKWLLHSEIRMYMSKDVHVTMSPCHHVTMSPCHHVTMSPWLCTRRSSTCHHVTMPIACCTSCLAITQIAPIECEITCRMTLGHRLTCLSTSFYRASQLAWVPNLPACCVYKGLLHVHAWTTDCNHRAAQEICKAAGCQLSQHLAWPAWPAWPAFGKVKNHPGLSNLILAVYPDQCNLHISC